MIKRLVLIMTVLMFLILAVGCSQDMGAVKSSTENIKEITLCESWGFEDGFSTIFTPERSSSYQPAYYLANFYETLVNYQEGTIVPGLAESWRVSKDGRVYTFTLKKGVKFSDGADFNAAAVKKNLDMLPNLLGGHKGSFEQISAFFKESKVIDEYIVEVHLTSPYYGALQDFAKLVPMAMMSPNAFNEDGTLSDKLLTQSMGTGPYMSEGQSGGNIYTFVRNPNYWGEKPYVDKFNVKVIPDHEAKALALRNGEIDMIFGADKISYDGFKEFSEDNKYGAKTSDENVKTRFLGLNLEKEPFNDKQVRLAVSHAIDKQSICDNLFYGIETKADTFLSRSLPYCDIAVEPYEYNVEKAKQLLEISGWLDSDGDGIREKAGKKLEGEILYITGSSSDDDFVLTLASSLKEIGMDIKVTVLDMMAWYSETQDASFTMVYKGTYGIPFDPYVTIANMNSDPLIDNILVQGFAHVKDGNSIIKGLKGLVDESEIQDQYDFILKEIHNNTSFVPISYTKELVVFNAEKITDYRFNGQPLNVDIAGIRLKEE